MWHDKTIIAIEISYIYYLILSSKVISTLQEQNKTKLKEIKTTPKSPASWRLKLFLAPTINRKIEPSMAA